MVAPNTRTPTVQLLGTGGEGETWLCKDKRTKEEVAVKLVRRPIPKSITQIIQREIKILADLGDGNLNIVHADEVILSQSHVGLVMEYVSGEHCKRDCIGGNADHVSFVRLGYGRPASVVDVHRFPGFCNCITHVKHSHR